MPLADEIRDLAKQSLAALDASHDYYYHTSVACAWCEAWLQKAPNLLPTTLRPTPKRISTH